MVQNLANHRRLRDEPDHAHPLTASAKQWVGLVDATDQPGPRLPALLEPGGFGLRGAWTLDAETVARSGYAGLMKGKRVVVPGLLFKLLRQSVRIFPRAAVTGWIRRIQKNLK